MKITDIRPEIYELAARAEERCRSRFAAIDRMALENSAKVMAAFQEMHVSDSCFAGTTGYGYDDLGRSTGSTRASSARRRRLSA